MDTPGFTRFWAAWPRNVAGGYSRKGSKQECIKLWRRGHHETQAETICRHVEWLKTTADWLKDAGMFIPAPAVYLRQQRWDGAEIPEQAMPETNEQYVKRQQAEREAAQAKVVPAPPEIRAKIAEWRRRAGQ
jgi:hypothetical protein